MSQRRVRPGRVLHQSSPRVLPRLVECTEASNTVFAAASRGTSPVRPRSVELLQQFVHADEPSGFGYASGRRSAVDDAEDGAAGADAEGQGEDRHDREARSPGELTGA
jgi:hypothetical protein